MFFKYKKSIISFKSTIVKIKIKIQLIFKILIRKSK